MSDDQLDRRPSDTDSQASGPASDTSDRRLEEQLTGQPAAPATPAAILMEALLAITQALKLSSTSSRSEIWPPTFNGEGDLTLFLKQFEDVADANGWTGVQRSNNTQVPATVNMAQRQLEQPLELMDMWSLSDDEERQDKRLPEGMDIS